MTLREATRPVEATAPRIPPLESGDRLSRAEFERRYTRMPHVKKAELIEGVVYMGSPVRVDHARPHGFVMAWLGTYLAATPGIDMEDNVSLRVDEKNEVQPDAVLRLDEQHGGASRVTEDSYLEGAPELIVEIAATSVAYDLHAKREIYRRNGVQEYAVWQVFDNRFDWWRLNEAGEYVPLPADEHGIVRSQIFPGLHLAVEALLAGNLAQVLASLQAGLAGADHAAFVEKLKR